MPRLDLRDYACRDHGGKTPGQVACEAFWAAVKAGPENQPEGAAWHWAGERDVRAAWEAAAQAAIETSGDAVEPL